MENYMKYHVMGSVSQVRMKPGCMPHKFVCQPDRKTRTSDTTERPYIAKKRRMMLTEECKKEFEEKSIVTEQSSFEEIASSSSAQQNVEEIPQVTPRVLNKSIQVHICKTFRSKANQTEVSSVNQMTSPLKPFLHLVSTSPFKIKHLSVNRNPSRPRCVDTPCPDGRLCPANWTCCELGCCAPTTAHSRASDIFKDHGFMDHPWYTQWPVLFFLGILGGILICCMWFCICKRYAADGVLAISCACCMRPLRTADEIDSAGSLYPPPHYSRCGSIHQAPPPYSEVQSKPDLYPLVITCADGEGKAGGNYVMVQYFQNYVIRPPPGSLSATSTAESLNSSFICNATNEANTIIPPPYSCSNYEEYGVGRAMLRSMSSLMEPPAAAPVPSTRPRDFTLHTPVRHQRHTTNVTENMLNENMLNDSVERLDLELFEYPDLYCVHECEPKPNTPYRQQPTEIPSYESYGHQPSQSPLSEARQASPTHHEVARKQSDERKPRRLTENLKWSSRKSSLYMPLSTAYPTRPTRVSPGARAFSMSAPATPCSNLVPSILNLTQRVSASRHSSRSSRLEEEYDPLLTDIEQMRTDDKF